MTVAVCPDCGETIDMASHPKIGQRVTCRNCDEILEVVDVNPVELDWAYDDDEKGSGEDDWDDWDDDWDEDDDWDDDDDDWDDDWDDED
jgi:lysine biosynthesis protein LysW